MLLQRLALRAGLICALSVAFPAQSSAADLRGIVSHYGYESGRTTASGVPFDPEGDTCAHWTLPFGTVLRVTDRATGRSVDCTVRDRGPHPRLRRTLDLSVGLGRRLGTLRRGLFQGDMAVVQMGTGATHHRRRPRRPAR